MEDCLFNFRTDAAKSYPLGDDLRPLPDCRDLYLRDGLSNGKARSSSAVDGGSDKCDDDDDEVTMAPVTMAMTASAAEAADEFEQYDDENDVLEIELV